MRRVRVRDPEKAKIHQKRYREKNREKLAAIQRAYSRRHPRKILEGKLAQMYGLAPGQYVQMVDAQNGRCAICGGPPTGKGNRLHVDHCHVASHVRGLLCQHCNIMLGMARENPETLRAAADYLEVRGLPISPGSKSDDPDAAQNKGRSSAV